MLLENLSTNEVEDYLNDKDIILVPVGSVEQHSAYGLIGTDFIIAEDIARELGEQMEIMVAPSIHYGISSHHMGFKGTATVSPNTFILLLGDIIKSFLSHGFKRILCINGHGGNINAIKTTFQILKAENLPGCFDVISWYELPGVTELTCKLFAVQEGQHATPGEISITKFLRPDSFQNKSTEKKKIDEQEFYWPLTAEEFQQAFPDGRMMSASWLASGKKGKEIFETVCTILKKEILKYLKL